MALGKNVETLEVTDKLFQETSTHYNNFLLSTKIKIRNLMTFISKSNVFKRLINIAMSYCFSKYK